MHFSIWISPRAPAIGCIQFSGLEVFESLEPAYLQKVKRGTGELGIRIDAGTGCICELSKSWNASAVSARQVLEQGLDVAHAVGATVMRCFMGTTKRKGRGCAPPVAEKLSLTFGWRAPH